MGSAERTCADEAARAGGAPACARIQQRDPFGRSADRRASSIACSLWTRQGKNSERARRRAYPAQRCAISNWVAWLERIRKQYKARVAQTQIKALAQPGRVEVDAVLQPSQ